MSNCARRPEFTDGRRTKNFTGDVFLLFVCYIGKQKQESNEDSKDSDLRSDAGGRAEQL
jgi:hypothetical protein